MLVYTAQNNIGSLLLLYLMEVSLRKEQVQDSVGGHTAGMYQRSSHASSVYGFTIEHMLTASSHSGFALLSTSYILKITRRSVGS